MERSQEAFIYSPYDYTPNWKVEIEGTDVTDDLTGFKYKRTLVNRSVGNFSLTLNDRNGTYSDQYEGGEIVDFYLDLTDATTLKFKGKMENPKRKRTRDGYQMEIEGSHIAVKTLDTHVTKEVDNENASTLLKDLIDEYLPTFTYNNVESIDETITANWSKPLRNVIEDICNIANADCFVDATKDFHFFGKSSNLNEDDAVVRNNLIENKGIGEDTTEQKTKITVQGKDEEGLPIIYTAGDGDKERVIRDEQANSMEEVKERAKAELRDREDVEIIGTAEVFTFNYLNPGELFWISLPNQGIHNKYRAVSITQDFKNMYRGFPTTKVEVSNPVKSIPEFMKQRMEKELSQESVENPNDLAYTYNFSFDDNSRVFTHSNTETDGGALKVTDTSGTMTSIGKNTNGDVYQVELRLSGSDIDSSTFEVSCNGGETYTSVTQDTLTSIPSIDQGQELVLRINLNSDSDNSNPKVESAALFYDTK